MTETALAMLLWPPMFVPAADRFGSPVGFGAFDKPASIFLIARLGRRFVAARCASARLRVDGVTAGQVSDFVLAECRKCRG